MSNTIINNHPAFICHYHKFQLPQFNSDSLVKTRMTRKDGDEIEEIVSVKPRDVNILTSQIIGCYMRGDVEAGNRYYDSLEKTLKPMRNTEHGNKMADEHIRRITLYLDNAQELGSKYILQWLEEKMNR